MAERVITTKIVVVDYSKRPKKNGYVYNATIRIKTATGRKLKKISDRKGVAYIKVKLTDYPYRISVINKRFPKFTDRITWEMKSKYITDDTDVHFCIIKRKL